MLPSHDGGLLGTGHQNTDDRDADIASRAPCVHVMKPSLRIVLGSWLLADDLEGGGHWSAFLQFLLGLDAIGVDVYWFEILEAEDPVIDQRRIRTFLRRFARLGFRERTALLYGKAPTHDAFSLEAAQVYGLPRPRVAGIIATADAVWNLCGEFPRALVSQFRQRVLIDTDPGVYQVSAEDWDMGLEDHDVFMTIGLRIGNEGCEVPTAGVHWQPFRMPIHLPAWLPAPDPGPTAPFTSITNLWGDEYWWRSRVFSSSKRDCYFRYLELPKRTGRQFELAASIDPDDETGDRERFADNGWRLVDASRVARTPRAYQQYIRRSRAEIGCPKPIHRDLQTGWFSDRSISYLASARPVVIEDTGLGDLLPTGVGLMAVAGPEEAVEAVAEIDADYTKHQSAAREIAEEFFDARKCLREMLNAAM
jgi:hypothetical protein